MVRPMVHSIKHYVQHSIGTTVPGTEEDTTIVNAVLVQDQNTVSEVVEGATVKAVYVELWLRSAATAASSFVFIICKLPSGTNDPTDAEMAALGTWNNKKNILYTSQGLVNDVDSTALSVFKGWVKIPKGKQRMGLGDKFTWHLRAVGQSINFCGFETYKEYT